MQSEYRVRGRTAPTTRDRNFLTSTNVRLTAKRLARDVPRRSVACERRGRHRGGEEECEASEHRGVGSNIAV